MKIAVIDYGLGNIGSVSNVLRFLGHDVVAVHNGASAVWDCGGFILPGVGSFHEGMRRLEARGLTYYISELVRSGIKGLGICLGMQLLCEWSTEGGQMVKGLQYFEGGFEKLRESDAKVPHIGWSRTVSTQHDGKLAAYLDGDFYYVHSFAMKTSSRATVATSTHGTATFNAALQQDNLLGVQFHPEKSQESGLRLINAFLA